MTTIVPFSFSSHTLRSIMLDGEPWFLASDICAVLGSANASHRIRDADLEPSEFSSFNNGKGRPSLIVSESGMYALVLRSRKAEAKAFRKWITSEVLPALRKTGTFGMSAKLEAALDVVRHSLYEADREVERRTQHDFYRPGNVRAQEHIAAVIADVAKKRGLDVAALTLGHRSSVETAMAEAYGDPLAQARLDRKRLESQLEVAQNKRLQAPSRPRARPMKPRV